MQGTTGAKRRARGGLERGQWKVWFEHLPLPAWIESRRQLLHANRAAQAFFGARSLTQLIEAWPKVRPKVRKTSAAEQHSGTGAIPGTETAVRTIEGSLVSALVFVQPCSSDQVLVVAVPASNQAFAAAGALARERAAREKAETALRDQEFWAELGTLVARVAHDIRNPLFGMLATLDALEAKLGTSEFTEYFTVLRAEGERLNRFLTELLAYGRPGQKQARVPVNVQWLVEQAVSRCAPVARDRGVALKSVNTEQPIVVSAEAERLVQAVQNIVQNAVQHSPAGSEVVVMSALREGKPRKHAIIEVWDSGPGFSPQDLPHIFEPFYSRRAGGTGMGLAIAARIAADHGGTIAAGNRSRGGAWVRVELPAIRASQGKSENERQSAGRG
ncbi:MAG: hypothetical protein KatS3mg015_2607 [Fimbriimonadales bacterium]|nr:MAG: hypothetical protein KatS3mg015_2607 [Fimbriimonadales bacterium]